MKLNFLVSAVVALPLIASAQPVAKLAETLDGYSQICVSLAKDRRSAKSLEELNLQLFAKEEAARIRNEVDLYSIGHGRAQTTNYMTGLLEESARIQDQKRREQLQKSSAMGDEVKGCTADAIQKGKAAHKGTKPSNQRLMNLTAAWIAYAESITIFTPEGEDSARNEWRREKAMADLN